MLNNMENVLESCKGLSESVKKEALTYGKGEKRSRFDFEVACKRPKIRSAKYGCLLVYKARDKKEFIEIYEPDYEAVKHFEKLDRLKMKAWEKDREFLGDTTYKKEQEPIMKISKERTIKEGRVVYEYCNMKYLQTFEVKEIIKRIEAMLLNVVQNKENY